MTKTEFLALMEDLIEVDPGTLARVESLGELEGWDSLAVISMIAMVDEHFGVELAGERIAQCRTVGDLVGLVDRYLND